jgi:hypothetical protein
MMTTQNPRKSLLQETIEQGSFWEVDDATLLCLVRDAFPGELERLKNAEAAERQSPPKDDGVNGLTGFPTPSEILYQENFDEVNRTLVGVLALRWIHNDQYDTFTRCQPESVRLQRDSFEWLQELFRRGIRDDSDLFPLVLSMVINDLGKDPNLEEDVYGRKGASVQGMNHDLILLEAVQMGMVPCLDQLDETQRWDVMLGLELGSELNAGQLAQAENVPINLEGLIRMRGHEHAFDLKFMEQILDVAGSAGHGDATCAKRLIEPVFQSFKVVHEVALEIIEEKSTLRDGYDKVLTKRSVMLHDEQQWQRRLSVHNDSERALLRLLTMGRTADKDQAELFYSAFHDLEPEDKEHLVEGLNIDGNEGEMVVIPYYMPAMLSEVLENTKDEPTSNKKDALQSLMRYLGRVLHEESHHAPVIEEDIGATSRPGIVIERNVLRARETINSLDFKADPTVLDKLDVPKGQILQRRRTSQSM